MQDALVQKPGSCAGGEISASSFDSLSAVELSNSISGSLGLKLPGTLIFDYPSLSLIAQHVHSQLAHSSHSETSMTVVPAAVTIGPSQPAEDISVQVGIEGIR